jgi:hypothetical protein
MIPFAFGALIGVVLLIALDAWFCDDED